MSDTNNDKGPINSVRKFVTMSTDWTRESLVMAAYWVKISIAFLLGLTLGLFGVKGFAGNISFVIIDGFLVSYYANNYLGAGYFFEEGQFPLFMEHMQVAYPLFVLTWTVVNTLKVSGNIAQ